MPYLIKAGVIPDDKGRPYFFAIGRSLDDSAQHGQRFHAQLLSAACR